MDFYNDRRSSPRRDTDSDTPLGRPELKDANARIRAATPLYNTRSVDRKIRTAAVQRHRARKSGRDESSTVSDYMDFICGSDDGCQ